jgi:hypothetical protein
VALPTTYDSIINQHRGRIPRNLLRALAKKESSFNPMAVTGSYVGLWQIGPSVREGYNARYGTSYRTADLFDPAVNAQIVSDFLSRIVASYGKHPSPNLQEDWRNPEFVKLVIAGHNSGYSEGGGVGRVARYLEEHGLPVTHDTVFQYADAAGATTHLQNDDKRRWQAGVVDLYFAEGGPGFPWGKLAVTVAAAFLVYRYALR